MNALEPGTKVKFKSEFGLTCSGLIHAVWIGQNGIQYQVKYFHNGVIQDPYVLREMFDVITSDPLPAGFQIKQ